MTQVITHYACPPIPDRGCDWVAYIDGDEELGRYGYGATERNAVADLVDTLEMHEDAGVQAALIWLHDTRVDPT